MVVVAVGGSVVPNVHRDLIHSQPVSAYPCHVTGELVSCKVVHLLEPRVRTVNRVAHDYDQLHRGKHDLDR